MTAPAAQSPPTPPNAVEQTVVLQAAGEAALVATVLFMLPRTQLQLQTPGGAEEGMPVTAVPLRQEMGVEEAAGQDMPSIGGMSILFMSIASVRAQTRASTRRRILLQRRCT